MGWSKKGRDKLNVGSYGYSALQMAKRFLPCRVYEKGLPKCKPSV